MPSAVCLDEVDSDRVAKLRPPVGVGVPAEIAVAEKLREVASADFGGSPNAQRHH